MFAYNEAHAPDPGHRKAVTEDPHYSTFLQSNFKHDDAWKNIKAHVAVSEEVVGVVSNRYITFIGCAAHMCDSKLGLLWLDTQPSKAFVLFAMLDQIYTPPRGLAPEYFALRIYSNRKIDQDCFDRCFPTQFLDSLQVFIQQPSGRHLISTVVLTPDGREFPILPWTLNIEGVTPTSSEIKVRVP